MTLRAAGRVVITSLTPTSYTPATSDTVSGDDLVPNAGAALRVVTTGTAATLAINDPYKTPMASTATAFSVVLPASGTRYVFIPATCVDPTTNLTTYTLTTTTGISCELIQF